MFVDIKSLPEIGCRGFKALENNCVLLGCFPNRMIVVHWHKCSNADTVSNEVI